MKLYTIQASRDGRRFNATAKVEEWTPGMQARIYGNGHGAGRDPIDAITDAVEAAELDLRPHPQQPLPVQARLADNDV